MNDELKPQNKVLESKPKKRNLSFRLQCGLLLLFLVWILIAWFMGENLIIEKPLKQADAIIILGGSSVYLERTQKAAELYRKGIAPKIFLTDDDERAGWSQTEQRNPPFVELAQKELVVQNVPTESIEIIKPRGSGTIYEAEEFQKVFRENNFQSVLLVTSAYHSRRALWTFEKLSADNKIEIGIKSAPAGQQTPPPFIWWLSPFGWQVVAGEYVKLAYYWIYF